MGIVTEERCKGAYPSGNEIDVTQICTHRNGSDACQADSGGPVMWTDPDTKRLHLVGIVSYGFRCATEAPGVNTRVSEFLDWVQQVTGNLILALRSHLTDRSYCRRRFLCGLTEIPRLIYFTEAAEVNQKYYLFLVCSDFNKLKQFP